MNLRTKECINAINYQYHMYACTLHVRVRVRVRVPRCTFVLPGTVQLGPTVRCTVQRTVHDNFK